MKKITLISLVLVLLCLLVSCNGEVDNQLWNNEGWIGKVELSNDLRTSKTDAAEFNSYVQTHKVFYIKETNVTRRVYNNVIFDLFENPECTKPAEIGLRINYSHDSTTPTDSTVNVKLVSSSNHSTSCWGTNNINIPTEWDVEETRGQVAEIFHVTVAEESESSFKGSNVAHGILKLTFKKGVKFDISRTLD